MTTVHANPGYQLKVTGEPPAGYPTVPVADTFSSSPVAPTYVERRRLFLEHVRGNPSPTNTKAVYYELVRLVAGGPLHEGILQAACDYVDARKDCADFTLHSLLRLLYQFGDHPGVREAVRERCEQTVLGFKYWPDEPGNDSLCTWTENHHILYASAAYLAGQKYPERTFTNSGHTGRQKMEINHPRILRWLDLRFHTGFSEWLSHVYYDEDLVALLSLADFSVDIEIRQRATLMIDLILLDIALNSFKGVFGSTHGRSYENTKKWASNEGTTDSGKLLFGMGQFSGFDNMSAPVFALSRYQLPSVLEQIAQDGASAGGHAEMLNRQRSGIRLVEAERLGLGFKSFEDGMVYLTLEAYLHPRTIALILRMFDAFNWWENAFFAPFKPFKGLLRVLRALGLLTGLARLLERDVCRNTREQVDTLTYRTPDTMLSTAQDYRKGYGGDQQHIWQATLGPDAVCFTTHPARLKGPSPDYWTGSGLLPRAAQVKNVAVIVYKIEKIPALYLPIRLFFTHAWLPRDKFDELVEREGWIFARKGEGYLALRSQHPYRWREEPADNLRSEDCGRSEDQGREVIADGAENVWLCELGRAAVDGPFATFIARICQAELIYSRLHVRYHSPSQGWIEFGWQGDLLQNGQPVALHGYPRYANPYVQAEFEADTIAIQAGGRRLLLDWKSARRSMD